MRDANTRRSMLKNRCPHTVEANQSSPAPLGTAYEIDAESPAFDDTGPLGPAPALAAADAAALA